MRELANASAHSAINLHAKSHSEISAMHNFGIALIPMLVGAILIVPGLNGFLPAFVAGIIAECVGAYYVLLALIAVIKKNGSVAAPRRSRKRKKPSATSPEPTDTKEATTSSTTS